MPRGKRSLLQLLALSVLGAGLTLAAVVLAPAPGLRSVPGTQAAEDKAEPGGAVKSDDAAKNKEPAGAAKADAKPDEKDVALLVVQGKTRDGKTIRDAPPFTVLERSGGLEYFPCSDCHEDEEFNPRERKLTEEHENIVLVHGAGRFWCITCHNIENDSDTFISMKGKPIEFDKAYLVCGQCHFNRQKDWYFGGHGKRVGAFPVQREIPALYDKLKVEARDAIGTWGGERHLLSCPACHNPHSPSIKPYQPSPPPQVRKGLARNPLPEPPRLRIWDRLAGKRE